MPDTNKHTPGPWSVRKAGRARFITAAPFQVDEVATVCPAVAIIHESAASYLPDHWPDANAALIAAAPDLLLQAQSTVAALEDLVTGLSEMLIDERLQAADIPDDFAWLSASLKNATQQTTAAQILLDTLSESSLTSDL